MSSPLARLLLLSAVVMGLSHTLAHERLFAALRRVLGGKETWLGYLVSCAYCCSHWIAFVLVPVTGADYFPIPHAWGWGSALVSWFLSSILVTVIAAFLRLIFYLADESQGLLRREERIIDRQLSRTDGRAVENHER